MAENIKFRDILKSLIQILYIILIIFVAYQVLKAIISGTLANENIIIAGIGIILAGMFVIVGFLINQGKCLGMLDERTRNIGDSLSNMGRDLKQHLVSSRM